MRLRWIYLGLVLALIGAALVVLRMGSDEVAGHALFHLTFAATILAVMWFIPRPISTPNLWLWRSGWLVSAAWWVEALGAFGYDDRATSAVPGLHFVHNAVAPLILLFALFALVASACAVAWTKLPRAAGVGLAVVASAGGLFMIAVLFGWASWGTG
jgi:hypothetical protein